MNHELYREYKCTGSPYEDQTEMYEEYFSTLDLLSLMERLDLVKVEADFRGRPHGEMIIRIDGVIYKEHILFWNRRFE